jgi:hypothetical protein
VRIENIVASVTVTELTGSAPTPTETSITNRVRLFSTDQATDQITPQLTYPVPIPAASYSYSFWKHICLKITGASFTTVSNIRHYGTGSPCGWTFGSGGALLRGHMDADPQGCPYADYMKATGVDGTTGNPIATTHTYYDAQSVPVSDADADTSGAPALIDDTVHTVAGYTYGIVLQVKVDTLANGAIQGTQAEYLLTWEYDES